MSLFKYLFIAGFFILCLLVNSNVDMPSMIIRALLLRRTSDKSNKFSRSLRVRLKGSLLYFHLFTGHCPAQTDKEQINRWHNTRQFVWLPTQCYWCNRRNGASFTDELQVGIVALVVH
uniref:Putative secreted protein n=1 Tax=Ixodes ricinus TaxID=34613 RepID=A0A6B0UME9_IXORI